jgi:penicillin V acylase-like amidase (Ntn superfamily)
VITNAPGFDGHMTNLRNYVNLSAVAIPSRKLEEMNFAPLGGGGGMISVFPAISHPLTARSCRGMVTDCPAAGESRGSDL